MIPCTPGRVAIIVPDTVEVVDRMAGMVEVTIRATVAALGMEALVME